MTVLSDRVLNRTTLERQLLLDRAETTPMDVLRLLVGMQGQDPELPYVGLWNRIAGFTMDDLATLVETGQVARATLFRCTQHLLPTADYAWIRPLLQPLIDKMCRTFFGQFVAGVDQAELTAMATKLLGERTMSRPELGRVLAQRWPEHEGVWLARAAQVALPIVHPYPDGSWG
ncbi:crosslink repair DNA glycosylase YcaQ family protein, partial [Actinoplanes sp. NPDC051633]|uniref:DNA glycosylase AlkZ-like family protein n=1 Tax=Actinoplanes sp. NPDC051633 TaxID=3155670 RepID=UPI00343317E0